MDKAIRVPQAKDTETDANHEHDKIQHCLFQWTHMQSSPSRRTTTK